MLFLTGWKNVPSSTFDSVHIRSHRIMTGYVDDRQQQIANWTNNVVYSLPKLDCLEIIKGNQLHTSSGLQTEHSLIKLYF